MTDIILAYVDGLPIPSSSSFFTRLASEYLGGGWVKCCSSIKLSILTGPLSTSGRIFSSSSSFSFLYNLKKPSNLITEPVAFKMFLESSDSMNIVFLSNLAGCICEDKALDHIRLYNLCWSELKYFFISFGDLFISVGLMASCASWAFLAFLPE